MAGLPRRARLVGYVLQNLGPATQIPWHRVVNAKGEVSYSLSRNGGDALQQRLLEEGRVRRQQPLQPGAISLARLRLMAEGGIAGGLDHAKGKLELGWFAAGLIA